MPLNMNGLSVELLYEIQLVAHSPSLPLVNRRFHGIFSASPPSYKAQYLRHVANPLQYPIACDEKVVALLPPPTRPLDLPRHLFRHLSPAKKYEDDPPLPFLTFLYNHSPYPPDPNTHSGYALTKAVHARFVRLVRFLLSHGASPTPKDGLAVNIAIRQKDLAMVKLLIERPPGKGKKRRRLGDRIQVSQDMLKTAVKCRARDIVVYFTQEKGCVPDMQTLYALGCKQRLVSLYLATD
uniref:Uncharacterized protein n=1 Tax=Moniliophthora roreri TaxID=221103 RepID=A0A0W0GBG2_MONRR